MTKFVAVFALLALAACSRGEPAPDAESGNLGDYEMLNEVQPEPLAPPVALDNSAEVEPEPLPDPVAEAEQIQDDADATGMTARLPAEEETAPVNSSE